MSTTQLVLEAELSEALGDFLEFDTTTNITTNTSIISTSLRAYDGGVDDSFNGWWIYITEGDNITVERKVADYATATGTITVYGANLAAESAAVTCRISKYERANKIRALNQALKAIFPNLYVALDDRTLITQNILPNPSFEDWTASTYPDFYTLQDSNITATALTTAGLFRHGAKSMNAVTGAAGAGKYVYITSKNYPRLLDLMGRTVTFKCWAYPQVANDASIEIYTVKADGTTTQTLTSTTTCPATAWSLLKLENQAINDDIVEIQFRFKIASASKYVYFDGARAIWNTQTEYMLPLDCQSGEISEVYIQRSNFADDACDDLMPYDWDLEYNFDVIDDGTYKYLKIPVWSSGKIIRLRGIRPFTAFSSDSSTISIDDTRYLDAIVAYAAYWFYRAQGGVPSAMSRDRFREEMAYWLAEYNRLLPHATMTRPRRTLKIRW